MEYLKIHWMLNFFPTITKLCHDLYRKTYIDFSLIGALFDAIEHLRSKNFIEIIQEGGDIERIIPGENEFPEEYEYYDFFYYQP